MIIASASALVGCGDPCVDDGFLGGACAANAADSSTGPFGSSGGPSDTERPPDGDETNRTSGFEDSGDATTGGPGNTTDTDSSGDGPGTDTGTTVTLCPDADGDGFTDPDGCIDVDPDDAPPGHIPPSDADDCDDTNANTHPGAAENEDPRACTNDDDDDGFGDDDPPPGVDPGIDCNDDDPAIGECTALWCLDADDDGFGDPARCQMGRPGVPPSPDHVDNDGDCNDSDGAVFPGAATAEPALCTLDADGDGFGPVTPPPGGDPGTDCDDGSPETFPGAAELETPPLDAACTRDEDGDGFGDAMPPAGVTPGTDCVDINAAIFVGAATAEPALCTLDADGDGFGADDATGIDPAAQNGSDCDDSNAALFPGAATLEPGLCTIDSDGDGWGDWNAPALDPDADEGSDCDDSDAGIERCALLVTQNGTANADLDEQLQDALVAEGFTVLLGEDLFVDADDAGPPVLVVISETSFSIQVNNKFRDVDEGVVCLEALVWDDMDMSPVGIPVDDIDMDIIDDAHPIAAGLSGTVEFMFDDPDSGSFHTAPNANAQPIASRVGAPTQVSVFAFEAGAVMEDGLAAPGRRVGFGADVASGPGPDGQLGPDGTTMFAAAAQWAAD